MTDTTTPPAATTPPVVTPPANPLNLSAEQQVEFERQLGERLKRERSKYSDYDVLKTQAEEYKKWQDAQKTEAEKTAEKLKTTEDRATKAEVKTLRYEVMMEKKLPKEALDLLRGDTQAEIEASADALLTLMGASTSPRTPHPDPAQGGGGNNSSSSDWLRDKISK